MHGCTCMASYGIVHAVGTEAFMDIVPEMVVTAMLCAQFSWGRFTLFPRVTCNLTFADR
jgi:hypothetical protein